MRSFFSNIFISVAIGLLVITIAKPDLANRVTDRVLGMFIETAPTPALVQDTNKADPLTPSSIIEYFSGVKPPADKGSQSTEMSTALSTNNIVDATNRERIAAGLPPLTLNPKLVSSATIKTNDMITRQYFEHISPTGEGVSDLGAKVGYSYVVMGENLALGNFVDGDDVVEAWMNSAGHRANILNPNYQEIGVYAAKGTYQGRDVWFAVQHFGTTRSACPVISTSLKVSIDSINKDLKQRQATIATEKAILEGPDRPRGNEYKARVTAFNAMVAEYNTALVISQEKIKQYNAQVAAFNACLVWYQAK